MMNHPIALKEERDVGGEAPGLRGAATAIAGTHPGARGGCEAGGGGGEESCEVDGSVCDERTWLFVVVVVVVFCVWGLVVFQVVVGDGGRAVGGRK